MEIHHVFTQELSLQRAPNVIPCSIAIWAWLKIKGPQFTLRIDMWPGLGGRY